MLKRIGKDHDKQERIYTKLMGKHEIIEYDTLARFS